MLNTQDDTCAVSAILMELPGEIDTITALESRNEHGLLRTAPSEPAILTYNSLPPTTNQKRATQDSMYLNFARDQISTSTFQDNSQRI